MLPRILSVAAPLFVYATLAVLAYGLYKERRRYEWIMLAPAGAALIASFLFVPSEHRLFFDEDIYISIASNLSKAPVAQITLLGGADRVDVSTYYKEPNGFPVLLSFIFLFTGANETAAFILARLMFAAAVAAVYLLARAMLQDRFQAVVASVFFATIPMCGWFSSSSGTDLPASLFATIGMFGIALGSGPIAAGGLAMAAQTRLEMIVLMPLLLLAPPLNRRWKSIGFALVIAEISHILWVLSIAPVLAKAERVETGFSLRYAWSNGIAAMEYLLTPWIFPTILLALSGIALMKWRDRGRLIIGAWAALLLGVYLVFYAGSFSLNPRYSIQLAAPLAVLGASAVSRKPGYLLVLPLLAIPFLRPINIPSYVQALQSDHAFAVRLAETLGPDDLVITTEPEIFFNQGIHAMNAIFASERAAATVEQQRSRYKRLVYYAGVRTRVEGTQQWDTDQWVKSNFELELMQSQEVHGWRTSWYVLLKPIDSNAGEIGTLDGKTHRGELW